MPQTKAKLLKGNHKILSAKGKVSKKLKAKHRLLRSNHKDISNNKESSKTPKDNANEVSSKPNKPLKKEIPLVKPDSQDILNRLSTDKGKIQLHKNKESSDTTKCLDNNLEHENSKSVLTSKTCDLPTKETVNNTDTNTNIALAGNKTRKRRKPFAHINETQDYLLSPIVLLERLSIEKIEQNIFTTEKLDSLICSKNIDNNLSTQISENINPSKRRKKSLHRSCTRRKSQSNLESEPISTCSEKESINQIVPEIKKNEKIVNLEKKSVEKATSKSALNKNKAEENNLPENGHSQNISAIDQSQFKSNLSANKSKNENIANIVESEPNSKKKAEFEKHENDHISANRKTSLRQKNQKTVVPANSPASVTRRSKNVSEGGINQHECTNEKRLTECTSENIQNMSISEENKNVSANETCKNASEHEKRKIEPKNEGDQGKLENKKFQKDCTNEKIVNKPKGKKGQNASIIEKSLESQNEPKNEKNKKSIEEKIENTSVSTRSKNKLESKSVNEKDKNEDKRESLNESSLKNSQQDKLESERFLNKSVSVKRRSKTEIKECQSELRKEKNSKDCLSENIEKELENEKGQNSPNIAESSKHTKEKFDNKFPNKKIRNTSATEKRQNEFKKEKVQNKSAREKNLNVKEKNKSIHDTEDESQSKSGQDKLRNDKHLNKSIIEECRNEPKNVENQSILEKGNRHNFSENKNTEVEENSNRVLNTSNMNSVQESMILDTIKSEIESDDDSSEENEVLNIKIFEMDNAININEDDLVSSQLKKSMRVESEPFKNNEVVNVKIFQIDKSLDIENCSSQSFVRETIENPTETVISATNIKLNKDKLKDIEEKQLIHFGAENLSKTVESNIEVEKPTTSDKLFNDKSKDIQEKILTDVCATTDDQEENENEEIESDPPKNRVIIKVNIVKIDKPMEVTDKTINDQIEGEEIIDELNYELDNGELLDTNEKASNYSPAKSVSKTVKKKIEKQETASSSEISKSRLQDSDIENLKEVNCNEAFNDKSKEIIEKTLIEKCAKENDQEKNLFEKICLQENEKIEIESEPFINNEILKIKIFENNKTLNIEEYFSEPCIEKTFEDKIESEKTTINSELNQDELKNTEEKIIESGPKIVTVNDNTEKSLIDSRSKNFIKNIQNKIKALETKNRKDSNNSESNITEENTLADTCSNVASKIGTNGITEGKDTKSSSDLGKEELFSYSCEKSIRNLVEDKIETRKDEGINKLIETISEATQEKVLIHSGSKSVSKIEKEVVEAEKTKTRNELRDEIPKVSEGISIINSYLSTSNTVTDKIEAEKIAKSNALSTDKSKDNEGKTTNDLYVENVIKDVQAKIDAEKREFRNRLRESISNAAIERSLTKSYAESCMKNLNEIVEDKSEAGKSKGSNVLTEETSRGTQEKMVINSCVKSNTIIQDKTAKSNVLIKSKSVDNNEIAANSSCTKTMSKLVQNKIEAERIASCNKLIEVLTNDSNEKSLVDSCTKRIIVEDIIEIEESQSSHALIDKKAKDTVKESLIDMSRKSINKSMTDKSKDKKGKITNNDLYVQNVIKNVQAKIDTEQREFRNKLCESLSTIEKSLTKSCAKNVNVEDKSKDSNVLSDEKSKGTQGKMFINSCEKSIGNMKDGPSKSNTLSTDQSKDKKGKTLNDLYVESVIKTVQAKIEAEKRGFSNKLNESTSNPTIEKLLTKSCAKNVNVEEKCEAGKNKGSNVLSDEKSKGTQEKTSINSCVKSNTAIVQDKTAKSSVLIKSKSVDNNEIAASSSCFEQFSKIMSKLVQNKIEAERIASCNELIEVLTNDSNKKSLVDSCTKRIIVEDIIEIEESQSSHALIDKKAKDIIKEKSLIDTSGKSINKSMKDKIEADKTTIHTDSQNKKSTDKEKLVVEACSNTVKSKIQTKEKTKKDNALIKDKAKDTNEESSLDSFVSSVDKSCSKTVSNTTVKEKIVEEKNKSSDKLSNDKSNSTKEISLIDSCEKHVSESVKNIAINTVLNRDKSEDTIKKAMPDICVKSVSKTKQDNIAVEKVIIDDNSIDLSAEIVSESMRNRIETDKSKSSSNTSNERKELKSTKEKLLLDAKSGSNITKDKIDLEKPSRDEVNVDKSKDNEGKSLTDSCEKNVSENSNNLSDEEITILNESSKEKSKEVEKKSLTNSCVEENGLDKKETLKTKPRNAVSDKLQNTEEEIIPDSNKNTDLPEKSIGPTENEVESREELSAQQLQENNAVTTCTPNTRDSKSSKKSRKKPNKYKRLKKHMIRKRKKKNRVKICGNELIKSKSSKMMELLGTICLNKIQDKSQDSERIVKPIKIKLSHPVNKSVRSKFSTPINECVNNEFSASVNESVRSKFSTPINESVNNEFSASVNESVHKKFSTPVNKSVRNKFSTPVNQFMHNKYSRHRDPFTGKFCSKSVAQRKLSMLANKSVPTTSEVLEDAAGLKKNKSLPVNSKETGVSNELPRDTGNTSTSQLSNIRDNFSNQNRTLTQAVENVVQEEITIEEHEIKIEEEPEVLEIIVSEEEEEVNDINYVTASEIFSGINSRANKTTSRAEILKNLRSILPINRGSSLLRTNCTDVNNEQNSVLESNRVIGVSDNTNRNLHRYVEQPSRNMESLPSQHLHNQNSRDVNIISDDCSNDVLYNNDHRNNFHSMNIQSRSVASTSANSNSTIGISVREAFEKISSDLLGAYDPQTEIDPQDYSNGINDLLHISDSDDDQLSDCTADSDHIIDVVSIDQHNYMPLDGHNSSQLDNQTSVFYQKPVKKKAVDETMHMMLECPRCSLECLGMKRLQRHYNKCGMPALFTCTICQTKLKQKRSLASHYLSYHADLVNKDTLADVIAETVRRSTDARNSMINGKFITLPRHVSVFCDKCQATYKTIPESHRLSCQRCLQPLTYYCEKCKRRQVVSLRVQVHVQGKCSERPCCPHCGFLAATPSRLHDHVSKKHSGLEASSLLKCRHDCGLSFRQKQSRQRHEAHCAKEKDQLCRFCPFKTKHRSVIKVHMQQHMINNDISPAQAAAADKIGTDEISQMIEAYCQMCCGVFETPVTSGTRCPRCHGGALYRCRSCSAADTVYREMRRHVGQDHVHQGVSRAGRPPLGERPCRWCGERFGDSLSLRRHQRSAGGCRPYCRLCNKSFTNASSLKRHEDISCGVAPGLRCEHCTFVTRNRFSIVRHMQTQHADVYNGSRLACPKCGLLFSNIYLFDSHIESC